MWKLSIRVQEREQDENKSLEKCHLNQQTKKITCSPLPSDLFTGGINPQQKPVLLLINDAYKNECDKLLSLEMDNLMDIENFSSNLNDSEFVSDQNKTTQ